MTAATATTGRPARIGPTLRRDILLTLGLLPAQALCAGGLAFLTVMGLFGFAEADQGVPAMLTLVIGPVLTLAVPVVVAALFARAGYRVVPAASIMLPFVLGMALKYL
ncbi:hypothetical protein [Kitasatospora sp. NPDC050543]|uniref:hypothetical protein n=1 Tax=Kitasatospora sp. NPDC050543 TaxID=3364054 RepID=UPI0037B7582B